MSSKGTYWAVKYEKGTEFAPSYMYRFVRIKPVHGVKQIPELGENSPFLKAEYLQTAGAALHEENKLAFAFQMGKLGVSRVTPFKGGGFTRLVLMIGGMDWQN